MGRSRGFGRGRPALAAAAAVFAAAPMPAAAAEEPVQMLPGEALAVVAADLDGDGTNEVVRLVDELGELTLDVWAHADGGWRPAGEVRLPERAPHPGGEREVPAVIGGLLPWRHDGLERLLVVTAEIDPGNSFVPRCCLAIAELRLASGSLELISMPAEIVADDARVVDLDGDGTGELITLHTAFADAFDAGTTRIETHRWDGHAWTSIHVLEREAFGYGVIVGESDGVRGDEVLLTFGGREGLVRLAWADGEVVEEPADLPARLDREAWPVGVADESLVLTAGDGVHVLRWPRGEPAEVTASLDTTEYPTVQVVGAGRDALVLVGGSFGLFGEPQTPLSIHDLALRELGTIEPDPIVREVAELARTGTLWGLEGRGIYPFVGPIPGSDAFVTGGALITPADGGFTSRPLATLIGSQPLGRAGPGDGWIVLGDGGFGPFGGFFFLSGPLPANAAGRVSLVPFEHLARPDGEVLDTGIQFSGAVEVERDGVDATLLAMRDGFTAVVSAPRGSSVIVMDRGVPSVFAVGDEALEVEIRPLTQRNEDEDRPFERRLLVLSPSGHASLIHWTGTFVGQPPALEVAGATQPFAFRAAIRGRTAERASIVVDGRLVAADRDGGFEAVVDAPIWPRTIVVTARDPLGQETTRRLEVVGFFDYRGLPWLPIVAVVTVGAGLAMFLRTPRRRSPQLAPDGDGRLEEIDADRI